MRGDARIGEDVLDQTLHAHRTIHRVAYEFARLRIELAGEALLQQLHEADHHAQRLLQVVRGDISELLEVGVGAGQGPGRLLQRVLRSALQGDVYYRAQHARRAAFFIGKDLPLCLNPMNALIRMDHPAFEKEQARAGCFLKAANEVLAIFRHDVPQGYLLAPCGGG